MVPDILKWSIYLSDGVFSLNCYTRQNLAQQVNSSCRCGAAPICELHGELHELSRDSFCFLTTSIIIFDPSRLNDSLFFYDR